MEARIQTILHFSNIHFEPSVKPLYITFQHYKHSTGQPHTILISGRPGEHCPVGCLRHYMYLSYRDISPGPLFILPSGPVSSASFTNTRNKCLHFISINASLYKMRSFRIDAASYAAKSLMHKLDIWVDGNLMHLCHISDCCNVFFELWLPPSALLVVCGQRHTQLVALGLYQGFDMVGLHPACSSLSSR